MTLPLHVLSPPVKGRDRICRQFQFEMLDDRSLQVAEVQIAERGINLSAPHQWLWVTASAGSCVLKKKSIIISTNQSPWLNYPQVFIGVTRSGMQILASRSRSTSACRLHANDSSTEGDRNRNCRQRSPSWGKFPRSNMYNQYSEKVGFIN